MEWCYALECIFLPIGISLCSANIPDTVTLCIQWLGRFGLYLTAPKSCCFEGLFYNNFNFWSSGLCQAQNERSLCFGQWKRILTFLVWNNNNSNSNKDIAITQLYVYKGYLLWIWDLFPCVLSETLLTCRKSIPAIFRNCGKSWEKRLWNPCSPGYVYKPSEISSNFSHCQAIELLPKTPDFTDEEL